MKYSNVDGPEALIGGKAGNKIREIAAVTTINRTLIAIVNNRTASSFDRSTLLLVQGLMSSSLMVPHVNSEATISAAMTTEKIDTRK
ncbi:hypothetical protein D3C85_1380550 [compost metagenome]